ncbi:MAG: DAK2 domain-containing protein, partial [Firmicutes bacterium]|nr:DAK2 domain-containing protein [Bacillota bacterium]
MQKQINGANLRRMIISGVKYLEINRQNIDALNVFPVPDGDTGTNMTLTMKSAIKELDGISGNGMNAVAEGISNGALKGARGNSGVILSQILRGFCSVLKQNEEVDVKTLAKALKTGAEIAYSAVSKPKEGTILTVIRVIGEESAAVAKKAGDLESFFKEILEIGEAILLKTPDMLPVLKKAGVVDAGGRGLIDLICGMYKGMIGEEITAAEDVEVKSEKEEDQIADFTELDEIEFGYCTEFFIVNLHKKTTKTDIEKLRDLLMEIGDSVIVVGDLNFVKVHVHTNKPGVALSYALKLGELDKLKIDNMLEQNRQLKAAMEAQKKEQGI